MLFKLVPDVKRHSKIVCIGRERPMLLLGPLGTAWELKYAAEGRSGFAASDNAAQACSAMFFAALLESVLVRFAMFFPWLCIASLCFSCFCFALLCCFLVLLLLFLFVCVLHCFAQHNLASLFYSFATFR